jgi:hypothetical protein
MFREPQFRGQLWKGACIKGEIHPRTGPESPDGSVGVTVLFL